MEKKKISILLIVIMVCCFVGVIWYPIQYFLDLDANEQDIDALRDMRRSALENSADSDPMASEQQDERTNTVSTVSPTRGPVSTGAAVVDSYPTQTAGADAAETEDMDAAEPDATEKPVQMDRYYREDGTMGYTQREAMEFDPEQILPQYQEIYDQNPDLVGWLYIPGTLIDYPVLQSDINDYYLRRDFYGEDNENGQLILDTGCDPWTPSYNLVISGHNMKNSTMFGTLSLYSEKSFWSSHKTFSFDSLLREGTYVVFAAFYSADYDVNEEGFRYNAKINYPLDAEVWLAEIAENCEYDTGIDVAFGDEFLTLTTCVNYRENGRFVVVARRVREGEVIK